MKFRMVKQESITPRQYYLFSKRQIFFNTSTALHILLRMKKLGARRIADVGCGPALITLLIARHSSGKVFFDCYDVDPEMLSIAQNKAVLMGKTNVRFHQIDGEDDLPMTPLFDFVFSRYVLHHVEDKHQHILQLMKMLRPGGELWMEDVLKGGALQNAIIKMRKSFAPMRGALYQDSLSGYLASRLNSLNKYQATAMAEGIDKSELVALRFRLFTWRMIVRKKK